MLDVTDRLNHYEVYWMQHIQLYNLLVTWYGMLNIEPNYRLSINIAMCFNKKEKKWVFLAIWRGGGNVSS